jgi:hypothetical protein
MGLYNQFETDSSVEKEGVWADYGDFRIKVRHAGGANRSYSTLLEATMKPYRRAIEQGSFPEERSKQLLMQIYSKSIVSDWETSQGDDEITGNTIWVSGIEAKDGSLLPVTPENIEQTFKNLPNLFLDIVQMASSAAAYRIIDLEADAKN